MKKSLLDYLVCPACQHEFSGADLHVFEQAEGEIISGLLNCPCGQIFPVIKAVPVMLLGELRDDYRPFLNEHKFKITEQVLARLERDHKSQVKASFGYKWQLLGDYGFSGSTRSFTAQWMYAGYGWQDEAGYREAMTKPRMFLDAGCGLGREVSRFCDVNPAATAIGAELSDCAALAYEKVKAFPNAHIVQADLMNLPFRKASFDLILSEGVLHHTPDTRAAFKNVCDHLAPGGELAIYIYRIKPLLRELADEHIRQATTAMNEEQCWNFCRHLTSLGQTLKKLEGRITIEEDIPLLDIEKGAYGIQEFIYRYFLKCFWNDGFSFDENNLVNFDWYHPHYAFRHTPEELHEWVANQRLRQTWFKLAESGMFFRGIKQA